MSDSEDTGHDQPVENAPSAPGLGDDLPPPPVLDSLGPPAGDAVLPPPGAPRRQVPLGAALIGAALGAAVTFGVITATKESDKDRLDDIAGQLCEAAGGEMRITVAGMVSFAVHQAEELGYEGSDLGSSMSDQCPALYTEMLSDP